MSDLEALRSVRFVVDKEGQRTAVQFDIDAWEALLDWLEELEDRDVVRAVLPSLRQGPDKAGALHWKDIVRGPELPPSHRQKDDTKFSSKSDNSPVAADLILDQDGNLIADQYTIAQKYPGEYVILIGRDVFFHTPDRQECMKKYDEAFEVKREYHPVTIPPDASPIETKPIFRGRSLVGPEAQRGAEAEDL